MDIRLIFILLGVTSLCALILFWMESGKPDKRFGIQVLIMALSAALIAVFAWLLRVLCSTTLVWVFIVVQVLMLSLGLIHNHLMYKQMWSGRDVHFWERDSIAKELSFSVFTSGISTLCFMGIYWLLNKQHPEDTANFWAIFLPFLLPLFVLKALDFLNQIPFRDYQHKWVYELSELDETRWDWRNTLVIGFQVTDSYNNEDKLFPKRAHFTIRVPREQILTQVYRLALRKYHEMQPTIPVQDIGYEVNPSPFWWLFYIKFNIFKPKTWFPKQRYLDPSTSIANNMLQNADLITARRVPFYQN